jgi:hypothetical protein
LRWWIATADARKGCESLTRQASRILFREWLQRGHKMDAKTKRWLAKELIAHVVRSLEDNQEIVFVKEGRAYIQIVTNGKSVLRFNPQKHAEEIIEQNEWLAQLRPDLKDADKEQYRVTCQTSIRDITALIHAASQHFDDALWILQILSTALSANADMGAFYPHVQAGLKISTLSLIDNRLRQILRMPEKSHKLERQELKEAGALGGREYAVTDTQMLEALRNLEKFSIKGLARQLGRDSVEGRVYVYDWMKRHDNMTREMLEKEWRKIHKRV